MKKKDSLIGDYFVPEYDDDAPVLILHSINDVCVSETSDYSGLSALLDSESFELYHFRFLYCPWYLAPDECHFDGGMGEL